MAKALGAPVISIELIPELYILKTPESNDKVLYGF